MKEKDYDAETEDTMISRYQKLDGKYTGIRKQKKRKIHDVEISKTYIFKVQYFNNREDRSLSRYERNKTIHENDPLT